jgi:hypothetical protein
LTNRVSLHENFRPEDSQNRTHCAPQGQLYIAQSGGELGLTPTFAQAC